MAGDPLGVDIDCVTDLDPLFRLCSGTTNLGNALLRRLNADAGSLASIDDDPNYGENVAAALLAEGDQGALADLQARVTQQVSMDERVQGAVAQVLLSDDAG